MQLAYLAILLLEAWSPYASNLPHGIVPTCFEEQPQPSRFVSDSMQLDLPVYQVMHMYGGAL